MIKLNKVSFCHIPGVDILKDVTAGFEAGRFYGIFGPNGCGKSTMLRLITGELTPDSGQVTPCWHNPLERARNLAVVEQEIPNRIPLAVWEVVALGRYPWERSGGSPGDIDRVLEQLKLTHLAAKSYNNLSGGERQRVMLARAVSQETPILLLDEPASSLDIGFQHEFYRLLRKLAVHGKCVIMVSHDLFIAPEYLDEAFLLKDGRIFMHGSPKQVITRKNLHEVFQYRESYHA